MKKYILRMSCILFFQYGEEKGVAGESITEKIAFLSSDDSSFSCGKKVDPEKYDFSFPLVTEIKEEKSEAFYLPYPENIALEEKWKKFFLEQTHNMAEEASSLPEDHLKSKWGNLILKWNPICGNNLYELAGRFPSNKKRSLRLLTQIKHQGNCHNQKEVNNNYHDQCIEKYLKIFNLEVFDQAELQRIEYNNNMFGQLLSTIENIEKEVVSTTSFLSVSEEVKIVESDVFLQKKKEMECLKTQTLKNFFSLLSQEEEYYQNKCAKVRRAFEFYYISLIKNLSSLKIQHSLKKERFKKLKLLLSKKLCTGELFKIGFRDSVEKVFELSTALNEVKKNIEFLGFLCLTVEIWDKMLKNPFMNYIRCVEEHFLYYKFFKNFNDVMNFFTNYVNKKKPSAISKTVEFFLENVENLQERIVAYIDLHLNIIQAELEDFLLMIPVKNRERAP